MVATLFSLPSHAQQNFFDRFDGYLSVGTADIFRGINRNDHDFNAMLGLRYELSEAWTIGARLNRTQFPSSSGGVANELEFNHFLAWSKVLNQDFEIQFRFSRYTYPGSNDVFFEYDYNELMVSLALPQNFSIALAVSDTGLAFANGNMYGELGWRMELPQGFEFSAALGGLESQSPFLSDRAYWDVGVSRAFGSVVADLRFHDSPSQSSWMGRESANQQWAFSLTTGW